MSNHDKQKGLESENRQSQFEELKRAEHDAERRLKALEDSVIEIRKSHLEAHKWFTSIFLTVVFSLVGILLAYMGNQSKNDVRASMEDMRTDVHESTKEMAAKVNGAIGEMQKNFQNLAGESLKKPLLTIATRTGFLDGQVFDISKDKRFPILPLFFEK